jgi:hypothetical protein
MPPVANASLHFFVFVFAFFLSPLVGRLKVKLRKALSDEKSSFTSITFSSFCCDGNLATQKLFSASAVRNSRRRRKRDLRERDIPEQTHNFREAICLLLDSPSAAFQF